MLKRIMVRKIMIVTAILLVMLMLYFVPVNDKQKDLNKEQEVEYIYPEAVSAIYLLDSNNNLTRSLIKVDNHDELTKANSLIKELTINGGRENIIPNYFKALIPKGTKVNKLKLDNGILLIDFSHEFMDVRQKEEEKLIEAITYTLTNIPGIDKISIYVDGNKLTSLPNSGTILPEYLDKSYGINKQYELTGLEDILSYTIYYVLNLDNNVYYTPVTKYVNDSGRDKVKVIIEELTSSLLYESNLMSYLDTNVKLLDYEIIDKVIKLDFNDFILSDITNERILEEVMYTVGLSLCSEFDLEKVVFMVDNQEISTFLAKNA